MRKFQNRFKQKKLGRHTGASPKTYLSIAWNVLTVTFPFCFINNLLTYVNTRWSKSCPLGSSANAQSVPKTPHMLSPAQIQLLDYTDALDGPDLVKSLKLLHNIAVYHSSEPLDEAEKDALFNVKGLWECIERIVIEG